MQGLSRHHPPCMQLLRERDGRVRRAGRWQAHIFHSRLIADEPQHMPVIQLLGLDPIETDSADVRMAREKGREVVRHDRIVIYVGIEAALPRARLQHIPKRDASVRE